LAAAGVAFYSTAFSSQALFYEAFSRLPTRLFALPLAVSMEAHYRERILSGNPSSAIKLQKTALF
ncbi:TPA: hypothetical protein ACSP1Z_003704, partial [Aeromonas hydrophila]